MQVQRIEELYQQGHRVFPLALRMKPLPADVAVFFRRLRTRFPGESAFFETASGTAFSKPDLTVMGVRPLQKITVINDAVEVRTDGRVRRFEGDVLANLKKVFRELETPALPELPFFQGGLLGHFGYECVRHFEKSLAARGTFAKAQEPDVELTLFQDFVIVDHRAGVAFAVTMLDLRGEVLARVPGLLAQRLKELRHFAHAAEEMAGPARAVATPHPKTQIFNPRAALGAARFHAGVRQIKEHIRAGDVFQAVLSERLEIPFEGDALATFERLRTTSPTPYRFYFDNGDRVLLGASPEKLVSLRAGTVETHPIAGTRPRGTNPADDHRLAQQLRTSRKEAAEHLMLVDLARNDIGRVSKAGSVRVSSFRQIVKYSAVQHLVSVVEGQLRPGLSPLDALMANFPAGTLSGAPKIRAMEILSELEAGPRGFYGGAVVALSLTGEMDSCIAIRSLEVKDGLAILRAGAGIVADSQAQREAEEVQHKMASLKRVLGFEEAPVHREAVV